MAKIGAPGYTRDVEASRSLTIGKEYPEESLTMHGWTFTRTSPFGDEISLEDPSHNVLTDSRDYYEVKTYNDKIYVVKKLFFRKPRKPIASIRLRAALRMDLEPLIRIYRLIEQDRIYSIREDDIQAAISALYTYYDEYIDWYKKYEDTRKEVLEQREGEASKSLGKNAWDVYQDFLKRRKELAAASSSSDRNFQLFAIDNAINQVHVDFPVIVHLTTMQDWMETAADEKNMEEQARSLLDAMDAVRNTGWREKLRTASLCTASMDD